MKNEITAIDAIDDKHVYWKECKSKNGEKYEVGYLNEDDSLKDKETSASLGEKKSFTMVVDWRFADPATWTSTTTSEREQSAITRYSLEKNSGLIYDYRLRFTNVEHYDYYFVDEEGDQYEVNCYSNSDHYVRYNSKKPTIVYVKGD